MADKENKNKLTTIPIKNLRSKSSVNDSDILVIEDDTTTYKTKASDVLDYTRESVKDTFVQLSQKGIADGVVPLDSNTKIDPTYLSFGETANTIYDGKKGKDLETLITTHKADTKNPHKVTKEQIGLGKVENKDSETIRSELTYKNVTDALGFTPEIDGSYENATAYTDKKIAELIGGASSTMDTLKELEDAIESNSDVVEALNEAIGKKANQAEFNSHINDGVIHVTTKDKENISTALSHSKSDHARVDATKVEESTINGNVKINDQETVVYEHPLSGVTSGTYRQVTVDSSGHVTGGSNTTLPITQGGTGATTAANALKNMGVTATASELNKLDGATITTDELNYIHGAKSNIQEQLNDKASKEHGLHLPSVATESSGKLVKSNGTDAEWAELTKNDIVDALGYVPGTGSNIVTAVKGDAEDEYKTGNVNITPSSIGLGNVDNTHDNEKAVLSASKLSTSRKIGNANFNGTKDISLEEIGLGNVGNFKAVSTVAGQGLTDEEKAAARDNIGAGSASDGTKMDAENPVGTGSFSLNRKKNTQIGMDSFCEGSYTTATGYASHAEGGYTEASGKSSHAEGFYTKASGDFSHASGMFARANQCSQFVVGYGNDPQTDSIFEVGNGLLANGEPINTNPTHFDSYKRQNAFRVTQMGQAIAQTGLGIGDTVITEDELKGFAGTTDANRFNGIQTFDNDTIIVSDAFYKSNIVVETETETTMESSNRAAIGFHDKGMVAGTLYLDVDGYLKFLTNGNLRYNLVLGTRINQIKWNDYQDGVNARPAVLIDNQTWVDIPTYNEVARLISQSPYNGIYDFEKNNADYGNATKYRFVLYDYGNNNFAGIGVDASGNIIFKNGVGATNIYTMFNNGSFNVPNGISSPSIATNVYTIAGNEIKSSTGAHLMSAEGNNVYCHGSSLCVMNNSATEWRPVYASAFTQQSSKKYKKNIEDISEGDVSKLLELRPVKYNYINENNGTGCYGLIAEEVDEVMSYPVVYDAEGNPDGIDYSKFVPYLIKMAQMQEEQISVLRKENEGFKSRLEKIETLLKK